MRRALTSSILIAGGLLVAFSLMPTTSQGPGLESLQAQEQEEAAKPPAEEGGGKKPESLATRMVGTPSVTQQAIAKLDRQLEQAVEVDFERVPLREALSDIAEQIGAVVLIDDVGIEEEGLTADVPVVRSLEGASLTARTALELFLERHGLEAVNRAGLIYVTTETKAKKMLVVKVYNVRDLIEQAAASYETVPPSLFPVMFSFRGTRPFVGGSMMSIPDEITTAITAAQTAQISGVDGKELESRASGGSRVHIEERFSAEQIAMWVLRRLIMYSTTGLTEWKLMSGGSGGSIQSFDGLLVVRQTDDVHWQIQKLLEGIRAANRCDAP